MTTRLADSTPSLSRAQRLSALAFIVAFALAEVLLALALGRIANLEDLYGLHTREGGEASDIVTGLGTMMTEILTGERLDADGVDVARQSTQRHVEILAHRAQQPGTSIDPAGLATFEALLADFDVLASEQPTDVTAGLATLDAARKRMKEQADATEYATFENVITLTGDHRRAEYLATIVAALTALLGGALLLSIMRRLKSAHQRAYEQLVERTDELGTYAARLEQANAQLVEASRAKDQFVSVVSHELRTPLTAILGFTETMLTHADSLDAHHRDVMLHAVLRQARRQERLVQDLLVAARLHQGQAQVAPEDLDLAEVAREIVTDLESDATVRTVGRTVAHADASHVERMLCNLVSNALKYGGDEVLVAIDASGDVARCTVSDNGPGVPERFRVRLFEPFAQADAGDRRTSSGFGLGLSIARELARANGGDIRYVADGPGATFELTLPLGVAIADGSEACAEASLRRPA